MYKITVELLRVRCRDTESLTVSDKFAMAGLVFAEDPKLPGGSSPFAYHMRINDGEERALGSKHTVFTPNPAVGIALTAFDVDDNADLDAFNNDALMGGSVVGSILGIIGTWAPPFLIASGITFAVSGAIWAAVDAATTLDKNDRLVDYSKIIPVAAGGVGHPAVTNHNVDFSKSDSTGYSDWDYSVDMRITCEPVPSNAVSLDGQPAETFRQRSRFAAENDAIAALPNFHHAKYGRTVVGGAMLLRSAQAEWRDVPLSELGNPDLDDFGQRMRSTQDYAIRNGFVGGFPNFHHGDYGNGIVCGTILLGANCVQWRDLPWSEIGSPGLSDIGARFRGVHDWAVRNLYAGGFPNMYHGDTPGGRVAGVILLKAGVGEWHDVPIRVE